MPADDVVTRYCPKCGRRARASAGTFDRPRKCPGCEAVVRFADYPREPPPPGLPAWEPPPVGLNEMVTLACGVGATFALLAAGLAALMADGGLALFLAFIALILVGPPGAVAVGMLNDYRRLRAERTDLRRRVAEGDAMLDEVRTQYAGFRRNFDAVVADERADLARRREQVAAAHAVADGRREIVHKIAERFLRDVVRDVSKKLKPDTYALQKSRLEKAIEFCRKCEYQVPAATERDLFADLKKEYEEVLRRDAEKRKQARIKAQIREEKKAAREAEQERLRAEAEQHAVEDALAEARRHAATLHGAELAAREAEIAKLAELLAEAEARTERTKSMAELTKAGHVYVISNRGSFGPGVFKVGMTRRLEPMDRVKELGDASVPFPFDVHMMISCDDAPKLENELHKQLHDARVNRVNLRKEYFRVDLSRIVEVVEENHGSVDYVADLEALEYEQSLSMDDDDYAFISEGARRFDVEFESQDDDDD
ncbi:GIY-YIG nuclease family protein [Alienimonas chondri]|uniref:Bacteriophage T5 Orf172 DNA-binding domain-containing protein n=1 Tax=Alienimonas chondri TaxID=2681879 RepID=A0ABX1VGK8_9PLAN|nr:GIY-YIG nuclease family protein [Alienimonas chondri]NNJ27191.1 hypothetical protein [Alienimonas chondri]